MAAQRSTSLWRYVALATALALIALGLAVGGVGRDAIARIGDALTPPPATTIAFTGASLGALAPQRPCT